MTGAPAVTPASPRRQTCARGPAALACALLCGLAPALAPAAGFVAVPPAQSGIDVSINDLAREQWGNGAAWFDYDNDGDLDLYVANLALGPNWLYRRNADGTFTNVADAAGVADTGTGRGVKFADLDNDGDEDFVVVNQGSPSRLYRNDGNGTFTDIADSAMTAGAVAISAAWGDMNRDGLVDLYVVRRREKNQLFVNRGGGVFEERAAQLGLDDGLAGLEAAWFDYDNDGDADLYLSNDKQGGNRLWRNDGGTFSDVSAASATNVAINSMGIALGDYDGNGFTDIYLTNTPEAYGIKNVLLRNAGDGTFANVAVALKVFASRYGWGCEFLDYDNDSDLDLFVVNWDAEAGTLDGRDILYRRNADGTFTDVTVEAGVADGAPGFGLAVADYDDDGFVDLFVVNNTVPAVLYRNTGTGNRWLKVRTEGTASNRDGIGARVTVVAGGVVQYREVSGGQSYLCQPSREVEFGLGGVARADFVEVRWPSGVVDRVNDVAANRTLVVVEGASRAVVVEPVEAAVEAGRAVIRWGATNESRIGGFRVWRRATAEDEVAASGDTLLAPAAREFTDAGVAPARVYTYVVAAVDTDGNEWRSAPVELLVPAEPGEDASPGFDLRQNQPNPFNPRTTLGFSLPAPGRVRLAIFDARGGRVDVLLDGEFPAGSHEVAWSGTGPSGAALPTGIYFYRLETPFGSRTRKMMLLK